MRIIGISGKKQSGKSTLADSLCKQYDKAEAVCFADKIRELVTELYISPIQNSYFDPKLLQNEVLKNVVHPCGLTYRQILQKVGCDARAVWPDVWVESYKYIISAKFKQYNYIFTPDVRFPNEVEAIHKMGGKVIRLTRNPYNDLHESETALDDYNGFDLVIDNVNMSLMQVEFEAKKFIEGLK